MQSNDETQSSDKSVVKHAQSIKIDNVEKNLKKLKLNKSTVKIMGDEELDAMVHAIDVKYQINIKFLIWVFFGFWSRWWNATTNGTNINKNREFTHWITDEEKY